MKRLLQAAALAAAGLLTSCSTDRLAFADGACRPPTGIEAAIGRLGGTWIRYDDDRARWFIATLAAETEHDADMPANADLIYLVKNPDSIDTTLVVVFAHGCMAAAITAPTDAVKKAGWESAGA
jgi:hypothetical protein